MPRFTSHLSSITISPKWGPQIESRLVLANKNAARAWLEAVILRIPVWSGEAMGSLKFAEGFGGFLGQYLDVQIPIDPISSRPNKNQITGGEKGRYSFTDSRHIFQFYYRSDVLHWIYHEILARPAGIQQQITAPWHALQYGAVAYVISMRESLRLLPKVKEGLIFVKTEKGL